MQVCGCIAVVESSCCRAEWQGLLSYMYPCPMVVVYHKTCSCTSHLAETYAVSKACKSGAPFSHTLVSMMWRQSKVLSCSPAQLCDVLRGDVWRALQV
jgi:hypothetical protein